MKPIKLHRGDVIHFYNGVMVKYIPERMSIPDFLWDKVKYVEQYKRRIHIPIDVWIALFVIFMFVVVAGIYALDHYKGF